jgi:hypothetical protein
MFDVQFTEPDGFCGCLFQSAESAIDNRESIGFDPSPERAGEISFALSGLASILLRSQGFHPWLLSVALSALRGSSFKPSTKSDVASSFQVSVFSFS